MVSLIRALFTVVLLALHSTVVAQYFEYEWEDRDKWQQPQVILEQVKVRRGAVVADIGSNYGYMTIKMAERVGTTGKVYAVDVKQKYLDALARSLEKRDLMARVRLVMGRPNNPLLPPSGVDGVLIMDTYHEIEDYKQFLAHLKTALKPDGRLVIVEPLEKSKRNASRTSQGEDHNIALRYVEKDLIEAGFEIIHKIPHFVNVPKDPMRDMMWLLVARKVVYN